MKKINNYIKIINLGNNKDYYNLENGLGFVVDLKDKGTCAIHTLQDAKFIAVLEFKNGISRGNHCHKNKIEYITVLNGKLNCDLYLIDNKEESINFILYSGQTLKVLPGCVHTYTAINGDVMALEYSPQKFEKSDVLEL